MILKQTASHPLSLHPWPALAYHLIRIGVGAIFVWSGTIKLMAPQDFVVIIEAFGLLPDAALLPAAIALSIGELVAGLGLIVDSQWSLAVITSLLMLFIVILGYGLWMGLDIDCGCFGPEDPEAAAYHGLRPTLYRDLVIFAGVGYLYYWRRK